MRIGILILSGLMGLPLLGQNQTSDTTFLSLEACVELAVENNLTVRRSELNLATSRVDLNQSKWALFPNLNANANYGFQWGRNIDRATNEFVTQRIANSSTNLNSSLTLFNGGRLRNTIRQNASGVEASEFDVEKSLNDVRIDVITFFLNVVFNQELVDNARYQLSSSQEQLERTKILVQAGSVPLSNQLELISQVATNEVNVVSAENNYNLALLTLKQALLLPAGEKIDVIIPEADVETLALDMSLEDIYDLSEGSLPEVKAADARVDQSKWSLIVARAGRTPTLALTGGLATNYSDAFPGTFVPDLNQPPNVVETGTLVLQDGTSIFAVEPQGEFTGTSFGDQYSDNLGQSLFLTLSIPIFNGYSVESTIQRSKIALEQSELNALEQRNLLRQTIETAYYDAVAAQKTYEASEKQVEALTETFRIVENQYNLGVSNFTDYQVASNNLFQAQSDLTRFKFDFIFKKKLLDFYQGKPLF